MDKGIGKKETKIFKFEAKSLHQDDEFFFFEGHLSTFNNEDRGGDIILKGAFVDSLKEHIPSFLWSHSNDEPLGIFPNIFEDNIGLFFKAKMPLADDFVMKRIIPQIKIGSIKSMSIGFSVWNKGDDPGSTMDSNGVRILKRLFLWEGSLVTMPMNVLATIKSNETTKLENLENLNERTLEKLFKSGVNMSSKNAKTLVSFIKAGLHRDDNSHKKNNKNNQRDVEIYKWDSILELIKILNKDMENKNG